MKRVLVLRGREDAERTAGKLRDMGFSPVLSPVVEFIATNASIPPGRYDAVLATSAKGLDFSPDTSDLRGLPIHVVGERAARVARARGWLPEPAARDALQLMRRLEARYASSRQFLYLTGRDRQSELEEFLGTASHAVTVVETYEARAVAELLPQALEALAKGEITAALHYSKRSAAIFVALARNAGLTRALVEVDHLVLSKEAASALPRARIAEKPDEAHLLQLLRGGANGNR